MSNKILYLLSLILMSSANLAVAAISAQNPTSILVLNPSETCAFSARGNSSLTNTNAAISANSDSQQAFCLGGNAQIFSDSHGGIQLVGGISIKGNSKAINTTTNTPIVPIVTAVVSDPFGSEPTPAIPGTMLGQLNIVTPGSVEVANPSGVAFYDGGIVIDNQSAVVTFDPGIYILGGQGLVIKSGAVSGSGVGFYIASDTTAAGVTAGRVEITSAQPVSFTAPVSGALNGLIIFQARDNSNSLSIAGQANLNLTGAIYSAGAELDITGKPSISGHFELVVDTLSIAGSATIVNVAP